MQEPGAGGAAAPAQRGADRATAVGTVLSAAGDPVAGAEVRCVGDAPPAGDAFEPSDVVVAATDERGRFRVELRDDRVYTMFALAPAAADGSRASSAVVEGVAAGSVHELRCGAAQPRTRLVVAGLDAWPDALPMRARVRVDAIAATWAEVDVDADGTVLLPAMPAHRLRVVLVDRTGEPLWSMWGGPGRRLDLWLPPPRPLRIVAVGDDGTPVAGAAIAWQVDGVPAGTGGDWLGNGVPFEVVRRLGTTGADGVLRASLPCVKPDWRAFTGLLPLFASAPGRAESWSGWLPGHRVEADRASLLDDAPGAAARDGARDGAGNGAGEGAGDGAAGPDAADGVPAVDVRFVLPRAAPLRGRVIDGGEPVAGLGLRLDVDCQLPAGRDARLGLSRQLHTATDGDGAFAFASVPRSAVSLRLLLQARSGERSPRLAVLERVPDEPLRIELAAMPLVRLQVVRADQGPPVGARALLLPFRAGARVAGAAAVPLDRAGRAALRVATGRWMVFATDGDGWALAPLDLGEAGAVVDRQLRLQPLARMRGIVRDQDGAPVAGAVFELGSSMGRRGEGAAAVWLANYGMEIDRGLVRVARSGGDGAFELRFVPVDGMQFGGSLAGPGHGVFRLEERDGVELTVER